MISGAAEFSPCMRYRYSLTRSWDATLSELLVVMLNPSTADAADDDPTIRRVRGFADAAGYGGVQVMNLFALRSTDPRAMLADADPVGPENDAHITKALAEVRRRGEGALAAWGAHGGHRSRAFHVLHKLVEGVAWRCLGTTMDGSPRHPLYVLASQQLVPFAAGGA